MFLAVVSAALGGGCEYKVGRDYSDAAGPVLNASSPQDCCSQCLKRPECIVAVFGNWSGGQCYTKLDKKHPVDKVTLQPVTLPLPPTLTLFYSYLYIHRALAPTSSVA